MTPQQTATLQFVIDYQRANNGTSPSYEEMAVGIGVKGKSGISRLVKSLEARGYIRRVPSRAREIDVIKLPPGVVPLDSISAERERCAAIVELAASRAMGFKYVAKLIRDGHTIAEVKAML